MVIEMKYELELLDYKEGKDYYLLVFKGHRKRKGRTSSMEIKRIVQGLVGIAPIVEKSTILSWQYSYAQWRKKDGRRFNHLADSPLREGFILDLNDTMTLKAGRLLVTVVQIRWS